MEFIVDVFAFIFSSPVYTSILFMSVVTALLGLYVFSVTGIKDHSTSRKEKKISS